MNCTNELPADPCVESACLIFFRSPTAWMQTCTANVVVDRQLRAGADGSIRKVAKGQRGTGCDQLQSCGLAIFTRLQYSHMRQARIHLLKGVQAASGVSSVSQGAAGQKSWPAGWYAYHTLPHSCRSLKENQTLGQENVLCAPSLY